MNPPGLLLVTRRYWPMPGGWEKVWARLLGELVRRGRKATVLTPRLQEDWPEETIHNGVRIVRLPPPGRSCVGEFLYLQRLTKAIGALRSEFDACLVAGLRGDAYAALGAARRGKFPVLLQQEQPGLNGDCLWHTEAACGNRVKRRCYRADAFLAATPLLQRELIAAGFARSRIHHISLGVPSAEAVTPVAKLEARRALAQADPALALSDGERLIVYVGRLRSGKGFDALLDAWRQCYPDVPRTKLWLVGEGPEAEALATTISEFDLDSCVRLTGAFDDVDDVYRAADLAVFPALEDGPAVGLLEAASHGLPIVASDLPTHRGLLDDGEELSLYARGDAGALARAIVEALGDPRKSQARGEAARRRVSQQATLAAMADGYERLIDELTRA